MDKRHFFIFFSAFFIVVFFIIFILCHKSQTLGSVSIYEMGEVSIDNQVNFSTAIKSSQNFNNSLKSIYAIDKKTGITKDLFDTTAMSKANLHIKKEGNGPKILIFHTHGSELYADSKNINEGVIGVGEHLKSMIEDKYGIECIHLTDRFDMVNGKLQRNGAYERAEPVVRQILKENPSIELVIDLHRDGVNNNLRLVTNIDGKNYAKIMFFNGICKKWDNGKLVDIPDLVNPYVKTNLALSYQMFQQVYGFNQDLPRKIYINAYRYSLHMMDKSMLIELGAQTNTYEEALNSIEVVGEALGKVCF
ncbi:MAG: stage II sporulation protein P [Lachnospirales bacterium]